MKLQPDEIAINLLEQLIASPSFSREEDKTALILQGFFNAHDIPAEHKGNNVWARNKYFKSELPTILLNSHHDTVRPNSAYTRDPFAAEIIDGKLYGLGSNDAGGALVCLLLAFLHFYEQKNLKYNLVMAATAEEEISGSQGIESIWDLLPPISCAIVGEPTLCQMAIAEKGLMVLDCVARGKAGHAAREEGVNAIYEAIKDIETGEEEIHVLVFSDGKSFDFLKRRFIFLPEFHSVRRRHSPRADRGPVWFYFLDYLL